MNIENNTKVDVLNLVEVEDIVEYLNSKREKSEEVDMNELISGYIENLMKSDNEPENKILKDKLQNIMNLQYETLYEYVNSTDSDSIDKDSDEYKLKKKLLEHFEKSWEEHKKDSTSIKWLQKYEFQAKEEYKIDESVDADASTQDKLKPSLSELKFQSRSDDRKRNLYYDCLRKNEEDKTNDECDEGLLKAVYEPKLWELNDWKPKNSEDVDVNVDKVYINIPVKFDFTNDNEYNNNDELNTNAKEYLKNAFGILKENTCINFVEVTEEDADNMDTSKQYLHFINNELRGCDEIIGQKDVKYERPQIQAFGEKCMDEQSAMGHYLMHILGFDNEHQRYDIGDNIDKEFLNDKFNKDQIGSEVSKKTPILYKRHGHNDLKDETDSLNYLTGDYDSQSIMHWSSHFISPNNVVIPHMRRSYVPKEMFSTIDLEKINNAYKCESLQQPPVAAADVVISCDILINKDADEEQNVDVPDFCLFKEETQDEKLDDETAEDVETLDPNVEGNSSIIIQKRENLQAKVTLVYNIEEGDLAIEDELIEEEDENARVLEENSEQKDKIMEEIFKEDEDIVYDNDMSCEKAQLKYSNFFTEAEEEDEDNSNNGKIVCGSDSKVIKSKCGEDLKIYYKLNKIQKSELKEHEPALNINVIYEDCEEKGDDAKLSDNHTNQYKLINTLLFLIF